MKKSSQRELNYRKKQRDDKNSTYYKNRSLGSKGWTNGVFEDLHRDFGTAMYYKLYVSSWENRLTRLLRTQYVMDEKRTKRTRKVNHDQINESYEKWKKRKLKSKKWINYPNRDLLMEHFFWKCQKSYLSSKDFSNQNLWEKRFNTLDGFNKSNAER